MTLPTTNLATRYRTGSIREELERRAWQQDPKLAYRLSTRLKADKRQQQGIQDSTHRFRRWQDRLLLAFGALLLLLLVIRAETAHASGQQWGLELNSGISMHTELAIDTAIQIDVTGLLARVEITQRFNNRQDQWTEGIYRFPLPDGAAVDRLRIKVGERIIEGEIQEKHTARRTYQKARAAGKTAGVIEQQTNNQFETRLANIGPGEVIEVTIGFLQTISYSNLSYHLRLPMTFTPKWDPGNPSDRQLPDPASVNPYLVPVRPGSGQRVVLQANLVSAVEYAAIESRYHDVEIKQVVNGYELELSNNGAVSDRDFELSWTPVLHSTPNASLTTFNDGESVYAQLMLIPPLADTVIPQAREVILIIDTSGSMEGASMLQAKAALFHALQSLAPDDYFNLLQFNSKTEQLFDQSVPVSQTSINMAKNFINRLRANGGTDMEPALKTALAMPVLPQLMRQVVFITDGAVSNETDLLRKVANDLGESRMFTVAIGYAPNSWFMRKTAEIGRGSYVHIGKPEEVETQMSALWSRIQLPALTDICIDWGESAEYFPEVVPDLYAGEPLWLLARLPSEPTIIELCGTIDGFDWSLNVNGWEAVNSGPGGDNLAKLWARKKIEALEDSLLFGADRELTQLQITALALDFGLLTSHTSLVAVDKTPRRPLGETMGVLNVPGLLPAGSSSQLASYPPTATGWVAQLLLSMLVLVVATSMLLFSGSRLPLKQLPRKLQFITHWF